MINLDEVQKDIMSLKKMDTSYAACERLAWLILVRDELLKDKQSEVIPLNLQETSEFLTAINGKDTAAVFAIVDDLMDTLRVVNPRVYSSVLEKVKSI